LAEVLTAINVFDVFGQSANSPYAGANTPKLNAQFVGYTPEMSFDIDNQPKLARNNERKLRNIEKEVREEFRERLVKLGGADLEENLKTFNDLITTFRDRIEKEITTSDNLDLSSLTTTGEWVTYWRNDSKLVQLKNEQQRSQMF